MKHGLILSLCDFTGNWSRPYELAGYEVIRVDLGSRGRGDVRLMRHLGRPVHGILGRAAVRSLRPERDTARWWDGKGDTAILDGLAIVDACLRAVAIYRPAWWALENPVGRLRDYLGPPAMRFDPCEFGDPYTERTTGGAAVHALQPGGGKPLESQGGEAALIEGLAAVALPYGSW